VTAATWRRLNSKRDHRWARSRVSDYLDGDLPPRDARRLARHEELCADCARLIGSLEILLAVLPSLRLPPAASFEIAERITERVAARIGEWQ
jgi:hypothetical protein